MSNQLTVDQLIALRSNRVIAIPSMGRAGDMPTLKALEGVPWALHVCIEESERTAYEEYLRSFNASFPGGISVITVDKPGQGIGYTRWFIQKWAYENGKTVVYLDDDLHSFRRTLGTNPSGYPKVGKDGMCAAELALTPLFELAEEYGYAGMQPEHFMWTLEKGGAVNLNSPSCFVVHGRPQWVRRIWTVYGVSPKLWEKGLKFRPECRVFEDMVLQADCLMAGLQTPNVVDFYWYTNDKAYATRDGGCQMMNRAKVSEEMTEYCLKLFPDGLSKPKKQNKLTSQFTEIQLNWKKLILEGKKNAKRSV